MGEAYNYENVRKLKIKEKELKNLQREKRIKQLELDNQRLVKNFFIISSFVLLAVFVFGAYQFRKISRLNKSLEKFNDQKEKFLRIISHDIKNSLGAVLNFSELIMTNMDELSKEEIVVSSKEINRAATATNNLLTNLLEWSLTLNNEKEFVSDNVNLKELVMEGISSSVSSRLIKNIKCTVDVPDDINITVDRNSIISVIRNLCTNAIKFSHENSTIKVYANKKNGFAEVTIEDEGVGIDKEDLENLFSQNSRKSTRGTMNEKGTGLGLSLVETFIKNNGGTIRAESEKGKGSKFIFTVPLS
jgi:signal transduction histidine kinase